VPGAPAWRRRIKPSCFLDPAAQACILARRDELQRELGLARSIVSQGFRVVRQTGGIVPVSRAGRAVEATR
jgi:ABC-type dipeptide/oligopeptide/nickel transport system ATPase component